MARRNSVLALVALALFCSFFFFAKHAPGLRDTIPFGDDPYDAIGSYAVIVGALIALVSIVSAFLSYSTALSFEAQRVYTVRSHQAVVLIVLGALAGDAVAMARHWHAWIDSAASHQLLALVVCLAIAEIVILRLTGAPRSHPANRKTVVSAAATSIAALVILAFYPEQLINRLDTHLLTILLAGVLLFAPTRLLVEVLVPGDFVKRHCSPTHPAIKAWRRIAAVATVGFAAGVAAFAGEMSDGGASLEPRLLIVAAIFIGLTMAGVLIAFAFLAAPLGLDGSASPIEEPRDSRLGHL